MDYENSIDNVLALNPLEKDKCCRTRQNEALSNEDDLYKLIENEDEKLPMPTNINFKVIDSKFIYFKNYVIGSGSFGKVYYGMDINRKKEYAVKVEKSGIKTSVITEEVKIYKDLEGIEGVPKIYWTGKNHSDKIIIMDLLGPSLDKFLKISPDKKLNLESTVNFGQQMVRRIQSIHENDYLHRDIKPNNFLLGKYNRRFNNYFIYVIDFGLSKRYRDNYTKEHSVYKENKQFVGTPRFASINTHLGIKQSRRDDLESIAYILIYFLISELPWQGIRAKTKSEKKEKIRQSKQGTDFNAFRDIIPQEIFDFLNYTKTLGFYDKPDYNYLAALLENIKIEKKFCLNFNYVYWEWNEYFLKANLFKYAYCKEKDLNIKKIHKKKTEELEKEFKKLYEGYPIQDFSEFLFCIDDHRSRCMSYRKVQNKLCSKIIMIFPQNVGHNNSNSESIKLSNSDANINCITNIDYNHWKNNAFNNINLNTLQTKESEETTLHLNNNCIRSKYIDTQNDIPAFMPEIEETSKHTNNHTMNIANNKFNNRNKNSITTNNIINKNAYAQSSKKGILKAESNLRQVSIFEYMKKKMNEQINKTDNEMKLLKQKRFNINK